MVNYWVCKFDGVIQCQEMMLISFDMMCMLFVLIVGDVNIIVQVKKYVIVFMMCGILVGLLNVYELIVVGYYILVYGFVGCMGFVDCFVIVVVVEFGVGEGLIDYVMVLVVMKVMLVGMYLVLVCELIGCVVCVYEEGLIIMKDFVMDCINIVMKGGWIVDIWFGQ